VFGLVDGKLNIEAMSPAPLFMADDDWRFATLGMKLDPSNGILPMGNTLVFFVRFEPILPS
jgi:hypothetical protein